MGKFRSTKVIDGFSTTFRQWRAEDTHCKFLHGYAISFKLVFEGELDERNWVADFGAFKRSRISIDGKNPKDWFTYMFDHTTVLAVDDPSLEKFVELSEEGILQLRVLESVGCEKFAEYVFDKVSEWVYRETVGRVGLVSVECREHEKNTALYIG